MGRGGFDSRYKPVTHPCLSCPNVTRCAVSGCKLTMKQGWPGAFLKRVNDVK